MDPATNQDSGTESETNASTAADNGDTKDTTSTDDLAALKKALDKERASRREAEKRAKALEPFEKKARELDEASKSDTQKLTEALEAEKRNRTSVETELARFRVAADKGVPPNLVRFLTGSTVEEIGESADLLLKEIGQPKPTLPGRPKGDRKLTDGQPSDSGEDDPMKLIEMARASRI